MQYFNLILCWIFFGLISAYFARKRGRNPFIWFGIGLFLGLFGFLILFLLPKANAQAPSVKKEPPPPVFKPRDEAWSKMWYFLDPKHNQHGPLEFPELVKTWKEKTISEKSFIWGEGMKEWKRLSELPNILQEFDNT